MTEKCFRRQGRTSDSGTTAIKNPENNSSESEQAVNPLTKTTYIERWLVRDQLAFLNLPEGCPNCKRKTIYDTEEEVGEHLQESHGLESSLNQSLLRERICPLQAIAKEKQRAEYLDTLRLCRDCMLRILARASEIRDGLDSGHGFKIPPHGLPNALLIAFESMILFVCATRFALENLTGFFEEEVFLKGEFSESVERLQAHRQILSTIATSVENQMRDAQDQIVSSIGESTQNNDIKRSTIVGSRYLAAQIVCSLLEKPVYDGTNILDFLSGVPDD